MLPTRRKSMHRIRVKYALCIVTLTAALFGCAAVHEKNDTFYQVSTITALLEGVYEGETSLRELKQHGDTGIGTFNGLDGEMIALDGEFYQVKADGKAHRAEESLKTPFAVVAFLKPAKRFTVRDRMDCEQLQAYIDAFLPTKNTMYVAKIQGRFRYAKTRSVPKQNKPYPRLVEVVKTQPAFEFSNVEGTIIGVRLPGYLKGINVPGYHFHFVTLDKAAGGHLLACEILDGVVEIEPLSQLQLSLPTAGAFFTIDLDKATPKEIERVEKQ